MSDNAQDIFLMGGSPSSGSTLLVELLSKHEKLLCLPETGLFAHGRNLVEEHIEHDEDDLGWTLPWLDTKAKIAQSLGWTGDKYNTAMKSHATAFEMIRAHTDPESDFFIIEKTPENIFAFDKYLARNADDLVILTSRDALSVTQSLMRRGFSMIEALLAWFAHSYETVRLTETYPDQVYTCNYKDLTQTPEKLVNEIFSFLSLDDPDGLIGAAPKKGTANQEAAEISTDRAHLANLIDVASWGLSDTSWRFAPGTKIKFKETVNLIGFEFDMAMDRISFSTDHHGFVSARELEDVLLGDGKKLATSNSIEGRKLDIELTSKFSRCLGEQYQPYLLEL